MGKKEKTVFICQQCGQKHSKWMGRCGECGQWNTVVEERETPSIGGASKRRLLDDTHAVPQRISEIVMQDFPRWGTDLSELDNVLGGGLVPGSVVLLGGEPGIGKSTLLLQAADEYAKAGRTVLYVSGEESASQIAMRSVRLGISNDLLLVLTETSLETIRAHVEKISPAVLIVDSIQTVSSDLLESQPGSVGQLRECTYEIINIAKSRHMAAFVVGHVTKEGAIAGPKVLEHMVDVVLYFEGTSGQSFRLLRSIKNRFGATNEIGVFEIRSRGLGQVTNPSELFLAERPTKIPGSVIVGAVEGTRPLLVEVQALASTTSMAMPRRTAIGLDPNRVSLLVAILEKRAGYRFFDQDVFINVAGGLKLNEPAIDLGVCAALISSYAGKPVEPGTVFFGEVGLGGEVRSVPKAAERLKEAARINLKLAYVPQKIASELKDSVEIQLVGVDHVQTLASLLS